MCYFFLMQGLFPVRLPPLQPFWEVGGRSADKQLREHVLDPHHRQDPHQPEHLPADLGRDVWQHQRVILLQHLAAGGMRTFSGSTPPPGPSSTWTPSSRPGQRCVAASTGHLAHLAARSMRTSLLLITASNTWHEPITDSEYSIYCHMPASSQLPPSY